VGIDYQQLIDLTNKSKNDKYREIEQIVNACHPKEIANRLLNRLSEEAKICARNGGNSAFVGETLYSKYSATYLGYPPNYAPSGTCTFVLKDKVLGSDSSLFADILCKLIGQHINDKNIYLQAKWEGKNTAYFPGSPDCMTFISVTASINW
jgi:hypothetical protein